MSEAAKKSEKKTVLKKDELVSGVAELTGETKTVCAKVIDAVPQVVIATAMANLPGKNEITAIPIPGIGTLGFKRQPAQDRMNNFTHETVHIPEHIVPTFKVSKSIKVEVNKEIFSKKDAKDSKKADAKAAPAKAKKSA